MTSVSPVLLIAGIFLILLGLSYPLWTLWQLNRRLAGKEAPPSRELAFTLALTALIPLTTVLAGFWLIVAQARSSTAYTATLFGSGIALVATLLLAWRKTP
ncbi:MAG: hypothetical protein ABTQ73_05165 [Caldilineales bacterium]